MDAYKLDALRRKYVNKLVFVMIRDPLHPFAGKGRVESVDDMGQLHGNWCGLAVNPDEDYIELM